jgi:YesN/AraC family two-component response regulator
MSQHGKRIKHMAKRRASGMTFKELGEEFDLSPQHVGRLVRGHLGKNPMPDEYNETVKPRNFIETDN